MNGFGDRHATIASYPCIQLLRNDRSVSGIKHASDKPTVFSLMDTGVCVKDVIIFF